MLGKRPPQRELFSPEHLLLKHVGKESIYGFLAREAGRVFRDEDFADLYGARGRPSVPPSQLCVLMILQTRENVSDQVDRDELGATMATMATTEAPDHVGLQAAPKGDDLPAADPALEAGESRLTSSTSGSTTRPRSGRTGCRRRAPRSRRSPGAR